MLFYFVIKSNSIIKKSVGATGLEYTLVTYRTDYVIWIKPITWSSPTSTEIFRYSLKPTHIGCKWLQKLSSAYFLKLFTRRFLMDAIKFTLDIFFWGVTLLSIGSISEITYDFAHKAARGQAQFLEIGKWNRALEGSSTKKKYLCSKKLTSNQSFKRHINWISKISLHSYFLSNWYHMLFLFYILNLLC